MTADYLQWVGYAASIIVVVSMMMNSIVKFRWINLAGALIFSIYGFMIGAVPVGILNGIIVAVDLYYIVMIYTQKEIFEILEIKAQSEYLLRFVKFHNDEIQKVCPGFSYNPDMNTVSFFVLRNMSVAGLFLAHREDNHVLVVGLDYIVPQYRDFKNGKYVYFRLRQRFLDEGFTKMRADVNNPINSKYFRRLGFRQDENGLFSKDL